MNSLVPVRRLPNIPASRDRELLRQYRIDGDG
jgi:hypothetical protein